MINLIWQNIARRRNQSLLTIAITAVTIFTFVILFGVFSTMRTGLESSRERLGADVIVLPEGSDISGYELLYTAKPENKYMDASIVDEIKKSEGIDKTSVQFFSQTLSGTCCDLGGEMRLVGYDDKTDFIVGPMMNIGGGSSKLADDEVILGGNFTDYVGKKTRVLNHSFNVVGELYPTGTGMDNTIFMNIDMARLITERADNLDALPKGADPMNMISAVMIKLDEGVSPEDFVRELKFSGIEAECIATSDTVASLQNQLGSTSKILYALWMALLSVAVLALIGRFNALAKDRKKEIGLMRAIGIQKSQVFGLILGEASLMALIGGIIGAALACLAMKPVLADIQEVFMLPPSLWSPSMSIASAALGVLLSLVICLLAALRPAWRAASLDPQTAISQGEVN